MVRLVRAATDRNPPTSGGGGCQIQWLIFLLIGNTMKNTMLRKGLTIF